MNRRLLAFLLYLLKGCNASDYRSTRQLEIKCMPDEQDIILKENEYIDNTGHRYKSYSQGDLGLKLITTLRKKSKSHYQDILNNVIMTICDVEIERERCVPMNATNAVKDWDGNCVQSADFDCPTGYCESASNCFWGPVVEGQNRTTRFPESEYKSAESRLLGLNQDSYVSDVAKYSIVGIVLAVIFLISWTIFFIGRFCCCCMWTSCTACYFCSPIPKEEGYSIFSQWILPSIVYFIVLFGIILCGALSFIGNEDLNLSASVTFAYLSALVEDLGNVLSRSTPSLRALRATLNDAAEDATSIFEGTSFVTSGANAISKSFTNYIRVHLEGLQQAGIVDDFVVAQNSFDRGLKPVVTEVQNMLDSLENDLTGNVDNIKASLDSAVQQINSFENQTFTWQNGIHDIETTEFNYRSYRLIVIIAIFLASIIIASSGFIGILSSKNQKCRKLHGLIEISSVLSAFLGSVAFIMASATTFASVVWFDACEISNIVTSDFEPMMGDTVSTAVNAIFNNTNLVVALNMTDKIHFEEKLGKGFGILDETNFTQEFERIEDKLDDMNTDLRNITSVSLDYFNSLTTSSFAGCKFNDEYSKDNILEPWLANKSKHNTTWKILKTGKYGNYKRQGSENASSYLERIYSVAGICDENPSSCCLDNDCGLTKDQSCNKGDDCVYMTSCADLTNAITSVAFTGFLKSYDLEKEMAADLGIECPLKLSDSTSLSCPTKDFALLGSQKSLMKVIDDYDSKITDTVSDLLNIRTTSVGSAMKHINTFLCSLDLSFVVTRYDQVKEEVCGTMLGGVTQINFSLWLLAFFLEVTALLACMLSTRLRGSSKADALAEYDQYDDPEHDNYDDHVSRRTSGRSSWRSRNDSFRTSGRSSGRFSWRSRNDSMLSVT